jgi:hypothetical protein
MFAIRSIGSSHLLWLPSKLQRQGAEQGYFELELVSSERDTTRIEELDLAFLLTLFVILLVFLNQFS